MELEKMSIKELEKQINIIETKKGVVSNKEIQLLIKLRNELSFKIHFKQS